MAGTLQRESVSSWVRAVYLQTESCLYANLCVSADYGCEEFSICTIHTKQQANWPQNRPAYRNILTRSTYRCQRPTKEWFKFCNRAVEDTCHALNSKEDQSKSVGSRNAVSVINQCSTCVDSCSSRHSAMRPTSASRSRCGTSWCGKPGI